MANLYLHSSLQPWVPPSSLSSGSRLQGPLINHPKPPSLTQVDSPQA